MEKVSLVCDFYYLIFVFFLEKAILIFVNNVSVWFNLMVL